MVRYSLSVIKTSTTIISIRYRRVSLRHIKDNYTDKPSRRDHALLPRTLCAHHGGTRWITDQSVAVTCVASPNGSTIHRGDDGTYDKGIQLTVKISVPS